MLSIEHSNQNIEYPCNDNTSYIEDPLTNLYEKPKHPNKDTNECSKQYEYKTNINKLAAGIAHEIRNPLTTVKGFLQLIKPYLSEIGKEQYAELALHEINRANDLIAEFLNAEKQQRNLKREISLNKLLKDISVLYESECMKNNIKIDMILSHSNPMILANENQMKQVLTNMIINAIEAFTNGNEKNDRRLTLSTKKEDSNAIILIEDNGCGMTSDTVNHMFTPFFSTKETGTGIGLSICKEIIDNHNGTLHISSIAGKGTIITINLPLSMQKSGA